jgi:hypothetical protein
MLFCITVLVDLECDLRNSCYDELLESGPFNMEYYETVMFIRLFSGSNL